jgi:hypothetical protein
MGRSIFILHSALTPNVVGDVLRREVDEERRTLFSPSGFRGDHAILGDVDQDSFRLRKRRTSRNDFAGQFYARFEPESGGTKIEGFFDSPRWTRYFMRIWLAVAAVIGIFAQSQIANRDSHHLSSYTVRTARQLRCLVCPFSLRELRPYERQQVRYRGRL